MNRKSVPSRILWIALIISLSIFLLISAALIIFGSDPLPSDRFVHRHVSVKNDDTVDLIIIVTDLGDPIAMAILTGVFGILLLLKNRRKSASILFAGMAIVYLLDFILKASFERERPDGGLVVVTSYSYPSGHTFVSTVFFLILAYFSYGWFEKKAIRWSVISLCIVLPLVIGSTRILLGVHWISDVLAGFALGIFLVSALFLLARKMENSYK